MSLVELDRITWQQAEAIGDDAIGFVAIGATEQHGPHLPMGTDTEIARALTRAVGERVGVPLVATPAISCGLSDHHLAFPGTISLGEETVTGVLDAHLAGLARMGIRRVALISGHGGNFAFIGKYAQGSGERHPELEVIAFDDLWAFVDAMAAVARAHGHDPVACDAHAGLMETCIALALYGERAVLPFEHVEGYVDSAPGWAERVFSDGLRTFSATGVLGRPAGATAAAGHAMIDAVGELLVDWLGERFGVARVAR